LDAANNQKDFINDPFNIALMDSDYCINYDAEDLACQFYIEFLPLPSILTLIMRIRYKGDHASINMIEDTEDFEVKIHILDC